MVTVGQRQCESHGGHHDHHLHRARVRPRTRRAIWNTIRGSSGGIWSSGMTSTSTVFAACFEDQFFDRADRNSTVCITRSSCYLRDRPVGSWFLGRLPTAATTGRADVQCHDGACSLISWRWCRPNSSIGVLCADLLLFCVGSSRISATGGEYGTSATAYVSPRPRRSGARLLLVVSGM